MKLYHLPAQLFRIRKEWKSILFWLLLPCVMTIVIMTSVDVWQGESTVPIALVVEEDTQLAAQLVEQIVNTELLHVQFMELDDALHKLEQHELDSVFVIREGYEDNVLSNRRNQLIEAYSSNRSFAYLAVVETIASLAQQDVARSKAAYVIKQLHIEYGMESEWDYKEIIENSRERQQKEALLRTHFSYYDKEGNRDDSVPLLQVWGVWSLFAMITMFFLFDWLLKENRPSMRSRWLFTAISFRRYALGLLSFYTLVLVGVDLFTAVLFSTVIDVTLSFPVLLSLIAFRLTIILLAFLLAEAFSQLFMYYVSGIAIVLLLIVLGGAIIPIDGLTWKWAWMGTVSPVQSLLNETIPIYWLGALSLLLCRWVWKGGKTDA